MSTTTPPKKPFKTFPLFPHANGQWAKKIRGKLYYFGPWDDPQAALDRYTAAFPHLANGKRPPETSDTVAGVVSAFLASKQAATDSGDLTEGMYNEYKANCDRILASLGKATPVNDLERADIERLRASLIRGKRKVLSPVSQKRRIGMARVLFNFANEELNCNIKYRKVLRMPSAKSLRAARNKVGERLFTPGEIQSLIASAKPQLKAMILLGINCGFGNDDCAELLVERVDVSGGWHGFARPKTQVARRCPLWPETSAALYAVIKNRPSGLVFVTKYGQSWKGTGNSHPISAEFKKLTKKLKIYRKGITTFYTLRRTFETIAASAGDQIAVDYIMGHTPASNDMSAVYRQKTFDRQLRKVSDYVHEWMNSKITLA